MGIDAGGTKTDCAISNGAALLGQSTAPTCKRSRVADDIARQNLHQAILQACEAASVPPREIMEICIGIAGASVPGTVAWVKSAIHELTLGHVNVLGDQIIAHQAAFGRTPGVLVIAGTGSVAYGRNERGETARAGGWGPLISDQGSAFWIGCEAVAGALQEWDTGKRGELFTTIATTWHVAGIEDIVRIANTDPHQKFSDLAGAIGEVAEKGDQAAQTILERAGRELAGLAGVVISRLWPPEKTVRVAMAGGVLQGSALVRRAFQNSLQAEHPNATVSFARVRPVLGALELAALQGAPNV
jgi:N-acetylglucosamine kinase-like BadF-type ATPase